MDQEPNYENDITEPYAKRRIAICRECPEYKMFICTKCGCMMPIKTRIKGTSCPLGKWLPES